MKFVTGEKTYPDSVSSTTKPIWNGRDAKDRSSGRGESDRLSHRAAKEKLMK